jgi:hypothetical protein
VSLDVTAFLRIVPSLASGTGADPSLDATTRARSGPFEGSERALGRGIVRLAEQIGDDINRFLAAGGGKPL